MSSRVLIPASEISTSFRCDNCGESILKVNWKQCKVCKGFNLCDECAREYPEYGDLPSKARRNHEELHGNTPVNDDSMELISVVEAETGLSHVEQEKREKIFQRIDNGEEIQNDYEMAIVMDKLNGISVKSTSLSKEDQLHSNIVKYHSKANQRNIRVISLDPRGVRGYMPIKILGELITKEYLPDIETLNPNNLQQKELFHEAQLKFSKQFDYFAGASAGGLIGFCLAVNYNIMDMQEIFADSTRYFKRNYFGPLLCSKYNPSVIHNKIDEIINSITFADNKKISAEHATLLDIHNLLNPDRFIDGKRAKSKKYKRDKLLKFVDEDNSKGIPDVTYEEDNFRRVKREKVLLITAYNTTRKKITIFNTSYSKHWRYRIADVLKSTMAAPNYFPPQRVYTGKKVNGYFIPGPTSELFIDGGVYANDPELAALWAIRRQWKKPVKYHILSIGAGIYESALSSSTWGGYFGGIFNEEILANTLMGVPGSFTELFSDDIVNFYNTRRMKLNYELTKSMNLDDAAYVDLFNEEWEYLKNEDDFNAFMYFYSRYFIGSN